MASAQFGGVAQQFVRLFNGGTVTGFDEAQLLDRFLSQKDEAAFEALVARFGPMVLGVCRSLLVDPDDVEDAFQATFLVLVKKAATVRNRQLLGNWLYGVAHRVALRARRETHRHRSRQKEGVDVETTSSSDSDLHELDELGGLVHSELLRLPEKYRAPIVLCLLEERTHEEAARRLGWPIGTVKGRLARAKDLLRERLSRRGVPVSSVFVTAQLSKQVSSAVPPALLDSTVKVALAYTASKTIAAGVISASAASALAEGVIQSMFATKMKLMGVSVLTAGLVAGGAASYAIPGRDTAELQGVGDTPNAFNSDQKSPQQKEYTSEGAEGADPFAANVAGSPSPFSALQPAPKRVALTEVEQARAKLNAAKLAQARKVLLAKLAKARKDLETAQKNYENGTGPFINVSGASAELMRLQRELEPKSAEYVKDVELHVQRMKQMEANTKKEVESGSLPTSVLDEARIFVAEAELWLAEAKAGVAPSKENNPFEPPASTNAVKARDFIPPPNTPKAEPRGGGREGGEGGFGGGGGGFGGDIAGGGAEEPLAEPEEETDPEMSEAITEALEQRLSMPFVDETPLDDVIRYLKQSTKSEKLPNGIPFYVDPVTLQEAEKTLSSPVTINLEGIKLRTTLRLLLKQLDLAYIVKDGLIRIVHRQGSEYQQFLKSQQRDPEFGGGRGPAFQ